jgi:methylated-DNA-[protein]-cysteine S-methyltransferase|tara:strand:- start:91 stop:351 length:261 start_codon:yes stop_codon:yes gene_type:complete
VPTKFQQLVWNEIEKIPYGETRSYKDIAVSIGKPRAARAVANACAKNPIPIKRPCHRVICSNGQLGGYSGPGGIETKKKLLEQESS